MYSFSQRADTKIIDEPFYASWLSSSGAEHIGKKEILASMRTDPESVLKEVIQRKYASPLVFFKQMSHHIEALDWNWFNDDQHIIFIRDPRLIIRSYNKVQQVQDIASIGIELQCKLLSHFENAIVLDSKELLIDPKSTLEKLCALLKIKFDSSMLNWEAGPRPEDGVWARYWYDGVHQSTGFRSYEEQTFELSDELEALAQTCKPFYDDLRTHAV